MADRTHQDMETKIEAHPVLFSIAVVVLLTVLALGMQQYAYNVIHPYFTAIPITRH